ncbi:hypothetical protein [Endozoicomonas sp. SESOKO2]|uniref:hypothetical protein n=2 Tax=unclassified Endozoicomonas TaxID=2644528 RepID=UPI002148C2F5|nr:hypothetical protein [Endozoicomonas sp. SESOKO2]
MRKLVLTVLLVASSTVCAEIRKIEEQTHVDAWGARVMTSYFDTVSEQYCLVVIDSEKSNVLMNCKAVHELSEQAQKNILGENYIPKSDTGASEAYQNACLNN